MLRRWAALGMVMIVGCSLGNGGRAQAAAPSRSTAVRDLQTLDREGSAFTLTTRVTGAGVAEDLQARGHFKRGNLELTAPSATVVIVDGVLYGERPGSGHWLEMDAELGTFLWPAGRPSLVWESLALSVSWTAGPDQRIELAGGLSGSAPDVFARASRAVIHVRGTAARVTGWEVLLDGPAGLHINSSLTVGFRDSTEITPPSAATAGDVLGLLTTSPSTIA